MKYLKRMALVLALLVAVLAVWLQFPRVKDPAFLEQAEARTDKTFQELQAAAANSEQNGFVDPYMAQWWGRVGQEYKENSPASSVGLAWQSYASVAQRNWVDHLGLLTSKDQGYLAARGAYSKMLEEHIRKDFGKPHFIAPEENYSVHTMIPNQTAIQTLVEANAAYVESLMVEGKVAEAIALTNLTLGFAHKLDNQPTLVESMFALRMRRAVLQTGFQVFRPQFQASQDDWLELARTALSTLPSQEALTTAFERDMVMMARAIDSSGSTLGTDELGGWRTVLSLPGMAQREKRIYINTMTELLKSDNREQAAAAVTLGWPEFLSGRQSVASYMMLPNIPKAYTELETVRRMQTAFAHYGGIHAYQAQHGRLPQSLDDLASLGLQFPEGSAPVTYEVQGKEAVLVTELPAPTEFAPTPENVAIVNETMTVKL